MVLLIKKKSKGQIDINTDVTIQAGCCWFLMFKTCGLCFNCVILQWFKTSSLHSTNSLQKWKPKGIPVLFFVEREKQDSGLYDTRLLRNQLW